MLFKKEIKWCFNYTIMMENCPRIWKEIVRDPIPVIRLCVVKKKHKVFDPSIWSKTRKGKVVSEYPLSMIEYLRSLGVDEATYTLYRVSGGSEAFLQCDNFDISDAIVETGSTLEDNQL
jgi:ATP phosphoribosyltransferase